MFSSVEKQLSAHSTTKMHKCTRARDTVFLKGVGKYEIPARTKLRRQKRLRQGEKLLIPCNWQSKKKTCCSFTVALFSQSLILVFVKIMRNKDLSLPPISGHFKQGGDTTVLPLRRLHRCTVWQCVTTVCTFQVKHSQLDTDTPESRKFKFHWTFNSHCKTHVGELVDKVVGLPHASNKKWSTKSLKTTIWSCNQCSDALDTESVCEKVDYRNLPVFHTDASTLIKPSASPELLREPLHGRLVLFDFVPEEAQITSLSLECHPAMVGFEHLDHSHVVGSGRCSKNVVSEKCDDNGNNLDTVKKGATEVCLTWFK